MPDKPLLLSDLSQLSISTDHRLHSLQRRLTAYLLTLCGSRETSEDLLQSCWLVVLAKQQRGELKVQQDLGGFLFRTAKYLYLNWRRKQTSDSCQAEVASQTLIEPDNPETQVIARQMSQRIAEAIQCLPSQRDQHILLDQISDSASEHLAPLSAVQYSKTLSRAKQRLRKQLSMR